MQTHKLHNNNARFDTRLPEEQKLLFERAAILGGYRNLTDFVITTVQEKAQEIIAENEKIIASKKDAAIFFNAVLGEVSPNTNLLTATAEFNTALK